MVEISALILATPDDGGVLALGHNGNGAELPPPPEEGAAGGGRGDLVDRVLDVCGSKVPVYNIP